MKRKLKALAAILLVLVMLGSAMPMQLAAEAMTPPTTRYATPDGYNDHDYQKMVAFFEQTDENGVRNGEKLSEDYDPTDPEKRLPSRECRIHLSGNPPAPWGCVSL